MLKKMALLPAANDRLRKLDNPTFVDPDEVVAISRVLDIPTRSVTRITLRSGAEIYTCLNCRETHDALDEAI